MRGEDQQSGSATGGAYRRRRRRSRATKTSPFRHESVGKAVAVIVGIMALFDVVWTMAALHAGVSGLGLAGPGMTRDDVRYAMGQPAEKTTDAAGNTRWLYHQGSGRYEVDFGPAGTFSRAACGNDKADSGDCPDVLGLHLGSGEEQIWYALGAPDRQRYVGDTKVLEYATLGLTFDLRRLQIVQISLSATPSPRSYLERLPRVLVP